MIICPTCAKENEDFFKFCLGCGSDLEGAPAGGDAAPPAAPPAAKPAPQAQARPQTSPVDVEAVAPVTRSQGAPQPASDDSRPPPRIKTNEAPYSRADAPPAPSGNGPRARAQAPPPPGGARVPRPRSGKGQVLRRDEPTAPDTLRPATDPTARPRSGAKRTGGSETLLRPATQTSQSAPAARATECRVCGAPRQTDFAFCANCGAPLSDAPTAKAPEGPRSGVVKGHLVLIREDGTDGETFELDAGGTVVGRDGGHVNFVEDDFLASGHAELFYRGDTLHVKPLGTTNGVFIRLVDEAALSAGDSFRVGQELLRFDVFGEVGGRGQDLDEEGTLRLGSPLPANVWGRLSQMVGPQSVGNGYLLVGEDVYLGRERGDITFPDDGYVSGNHAMLARRGDDVFVKDLGSSNGTYLRIKGERELGQGDFILAGQQLFRIDP